ncbi:hypothetical protein BX666DRAFT_1848096 [Dichotomocladium elegans]|nr:hypothetical protein BX666DRAFT_1848096 [Dichotomocladium elegans]
MFGRRTPATAKSGSTHRQLDIDNLDELLNGTIPGIDDEADETDLNDPELLQKQANAEKKKARLRTIGAQQQQQADDEHFDIDSYTVLAQGDDIDVDKVTLDDSDLNDPHLLEHRDKALPAITEQSQYQDDMDMMDEDEEPTELFNDPKELLRRVKHYQKLAVTAKRAGDKRKAIEFLRHSKNLNLKYNELYMPKAEPKANATIPVTIDPVAMDESLDSASDAPDIHMPPPPAAVSSPTSVDPPLPVQTVHHTSSPLPNNEIPVTSRPEQSPSPEVPHDQAVFQQVLQLQKEYKEAAIYYKGIGNLVAAREMLKVSKELLRVGIQFKNGEVTNVEAVRRKLPEKPNLSLGDGKMRQIQTVSNTIATGSSSPGQTFEHLESQLIYQIDVCHNLAIQSSNTHGPKAGGKTLAGSCNYFQQLEQAFTADMVSLRSHRDQDMQRMPQLHYELVNYRYKNILDHIPVNQMELKIVRGIGLQSLDVPTNLEPYVTWDLGGWPPENTAHASLGKGETAVRKGGDPVEFDVAVQIPIMRGNRIFIRYIQRRKLTLEVFHNRYSYGLFRRPLSLGKVSLPLETLMTKCSISGAFDIIDANRRKTGGKLEVQLSLREPLTGEDIAQRAERWLVIDEFGQNTSAILASAGLTSVPYQPKHQSLPSPATAASPTSSTAAVVSSSSSPKPSNAATATVADPLKGSSKPATPIKSSESLESPEIEEAEEEYNNVDSIVSNMVLEYEMNLVNTALASGGVRAGVSKEDLLDRRQALEIKMNMLVIQVQTGMLDMDTYIQNVRKRMDRDRQLALIFKKHNRLDLAKGALARKKIMQDEIEEAEAAMAAQEEE